VQLVRGASGYGVNSFVDNGDGTVTDASTGLMWTKQDGGSAQTWQEALGFVQARNAANHLGHNDWRLPNAKELHSLVDYAHAPDFDGMPAIDTRFFSCTAITNENGDADYPYYWTSTTHAGYSATGSAGGSAAYIPFGRALGRPDGAARDGWTSTAQAASAVTPRPVRPSVSTRSTGSPGAGRRTPATPSGPRATRSAASISSGWFATLGEGSGLQRVIEYENCTMPLTFEGGASSWGRKMRTYSTSTDAGDTVTRT